MKFCAILIFITLFTESFAQFTKGDKVWGGSFYLNIQRDPENADGGFIKKTSVSLSPNAGILITSNLEIGGLFGYSWIKDRGRGFSSSPIYESGSQDFTIGFYAQRYFTIAEKFLLTLQGEADYSIGKSYDNPDNRVREVTKRESWVLKLTPKFIFFPSANWGIHAGLGNVSYSYFKRSQSTTSHIFDISYSGVILGVSYYIRH